MNTHTELAGQNLVAIAYYAPRVHVEEHISPSYAVLCGDESNADVDEMTEEIEFALDSLQQESGVVVSDHPTPHGTKWLIPAFADCTTAEEIVDLLGDVVREDLVDFDETYNIASIEAGLERQAQRYEMGAFGAMAS